MKDYLKKHETQAAYTTWAASANYVTPNVSLVEATMGVNYLPYVAPVVPQHDYVEIGGIKWATMNLGANSVTDPGLYYSWGDTQGYTAAQVGSGEGKKYFGGKDYKYGNGTINPDATDMTKYNSTDGKIVLDASDDAVTAAWGGSWRIPTTDEYDALGAAVNYTWTADYQGSGVAGLVLTDKSDSSKVLFFPAAGRGYNGSVDSVGIYFGCWSSSLSSYMAYGNLATFTYGSTIVKTPNWHGSSSRFIGHAIRGVYIG